MSKKARGRKQNQEKNNKFQRFKRHTNWHHVYPTSRFKIRKNPVLHTAWHDVFQNLTPEDAIEAVKEWAADSKKFEEEIRGNTRRFSAWMMLFGDSATPSSEEVIGIIKKDWTFHGVKMIKTKET